MIKRVDCTKEHVEVSISRSYYWDLIKQYGHSKDCAKQASLNSSKSDDDRDPNENIVDTGNGEKEVAKENFEASSRHSAMYTKAEKNSILPTRNHREGDESTK